ncbi:MAG: quercetin dioxygenase-like cupin family protein [Bradymonadia bacterium]|jgi:quercetin dioxygenase-like cupin family protein
MFRLTTVCLLAMTGSALALSPLMQPKPIVEPVLDQPSVKVVKITLAPGAVLPTHSTPVHATVVALSSTGTVVIGDKTHPLASSGTVFLPKVVPHCVINNGSVPLVVHHLKP